MSRTSGASVVLINGALSAFLRRTNPSLRVFLPEAEPDRSHYARVLARKLAEVALRRQGPREGLMVSEINGAPAQEHLLAPFLEEAGFVLTALGFQMRRLDRATSTGSDDADDDATENDEA